MSYIQLYCKILLSLILLNVFSLILVGEAHQLHKRQVGVLARAGALPQGKRSVEVLARNGELPQIGGKKETDREDLLVEELEKEDSLSRLRARTLGDRIMEEEDPERFGGGKRSVSALARNGELPQKRLSIAMTRLGYLVRPPPEPAQPTVDLFDPDDFLAEDQPSIGEFLEERSFRPFKRTLGRNFLMEFGLNSYNKKNLASLARDGGFASLRHPSTKQRRMDDTYEMHDDDKKDVDAIEKREISRNCRENSQIFQIPGKSSSKRRKRGQFDDDYEDVFYAQEGSPVEKRFLGRIPQLGRIHQKVQAPSARRRPHLRPNWL